jgi:hypothetical protein
MICAVSPKLLRPKIKSVGVLCNTYGGGKRRKAKMLGGRHEGKISLGSRSVYGMLINI